MKLIRMTDEPVLKPIKEHDWEKSAVFNAALVYENDLFHMIYRATDIGGSEKYGRYINSLGYAVSSDMLTWKRRTNPTKARTRGHCLHLYRRHVWHWHIVQCQAWRSRRWGEVFSTL